MVLSKPFTATILAVLAVTAGASAASGDPPIVSASACTSPRTIECCQTVANIRDIHLETLQSLVAMPDINPFVGAMCTPATAQPISCHVGLSPLCCGIIFQISCLVETWVARDIETVAPK
ncbi:hypothetical protein L218DRAFT_949510 [Marasmius fiardii PR-910]|nr:hypothetical protein L218DRAFT_949510 [Marasmius fiardii PR-910]